MLARGEQYSIQNQPEIAHAKETHRSGSCRGTYRPPGQPGRNEVYGRAHVSVDQLDDGTDSGTNVSSNSSRIGFKADKDLENGMTALFQAEQEIRYDNGSGADWASRDSFVGLKGDFGMVRLGYFDTPLKTVRSRTDLFGDQIGDARNLTRLKELRCRFRYPFPQWHSLPHAEHQWPDR
jgi:predicted porin